jgi:hypothetical protein
MHMTQRRVAATNRLSTVIDALQLGKKTGILAVERGEGSMFEEGMIMLAYGQVAYATTSSYTGASYVGKDAMTRLSTWQACRFSFVPLSPEEITRRMPSPPPLQSGKRTVAGMPDQPFHGSGASSTIPGAQSDMERKPLVSVYYKESTEDFLHRLDRQGLSRTHRRLFLLIDGRRSIRELALLAGRMPDETLSLLKDLERAGLIMM